MQNERLAGRILTVLFSLTGLALLTGAAADGTLSGLRSAFINDSLQSDILLKSHSVEQLMLRLNGKLFSFLDMSAFYNDIGIYLADDGYIMSDAKKTAADYEVNQTLRLKEYLDARGINLIYVNQPVKYLHDADFFQEFQKQTYSNANADLFLSRIREAGVHTVDLRTDIESEQLDIRHMFYRTDHHWTVPAGLWASGKIADALNRFAGYDIDPALYDPENYTFTTLPQCWVGEQGQKISQELAGRDDYTYAVPDFPTALLRPDAEEPCALSALISQELLDDAAAGREVWSMHYAYPCVSLTNPAVSEGNILMLCDSYANATEPFLALGVHHVEPVVLRGVQMNAQEIIEAGDYDTVLICYAQFMIGAYDDPSSANHRMFDFTPE